MRVATAIYFMFISAVVFAICLLPAQSFRSLRFAGTGGSLHRKNKESTIVLAAGPDPALLLPTLLGTTAVVFFLFNGVDVNSKVDLTDAGRARAKQQRRAERIARGDYKPVDKEGLDPYRYRLPFEDDDDEIDIIGGPPKTGGCG